MLVTEWPFSSCEKENVCIKSKIMHYKFIPFHSLSLNLCVHKILTFYSLNKILEIFACLQVTHQHQCVIPEDVKDWTIHGLWPSCSDGKYPQYCTQDKFDWSKVQVYMFIKYNISIDYYCSNVANSRKGNGSNGDRTHDLSLYVLWPDAITLFYSDEGSYLSIEPESYEPVECHRKDKILL